MLQTSSSQDTGSGVKSSRTSHPSDTTQQTHSPLRTIGACHIPTLRYGIAISLGSSHTSKSHWLLRTKRSSSHHTAWEARFFTISSTGCNLNGVAVVDLIGLNVTSRPGSTSVAACL